MFQYVLCLSCIFQKTHMRVDPVGFHRPFARDGCDKHFRGSFAACIWAFAAPSENDSLFVAAHLGIPPVQGIPCGRTWFAQTDGGGSADFINYSFRNNKNPTQGLGSFFWQKTCHFGFEFFAVRQACRSWRKPFRLCFSLPGQMPTEFSFARYWHCLNAWWAEHEQSHEQRCEKRPFVYIIGLG